MERRKTWSGWIGTTLTLALIIGVVLLGADQSVAKPYVRGTPASHRTLEPDERADISST
jgi:hypothetical protein